MTEPIDTANDHLVGWSSRGVSIALPPVGPMGQDEALRLAAWIVAIADMEGDRFPAVLEAVRNT